MKIVVGLAVGHAVVDDLPGPDVTNDTSSNVACRGSILAGRHEPVHVETRFGPHP